MSELLASNAHCAPQWPHSVCKDRVVADALRAVTAAQSVGQLLAADNAIRGSADESEDPAAEGLPAPFDRFTRDGLLCALAICLDQAANAVDTIAERERSQGASQGIARVTSLYPREKRRVRRPIGAT